MVAQFMDGAGELRTLAVVIKGNETYPTDSILTSLTDSPHSRSLHDLSHNYSVVRPGPNAGLTASEACVSIPDGWFVVVLGFIA
jgi:hypothetical protein